MSPRPFTFRIGMPEPYGVLPNAALDHDMPLLVSANSMYDHKRGYFRVPKYPGFMESDTALDSAGFIAMHKYGGFPWTLAQYCELAGSYSWAWWAQMDLCCEPEIAADAEEVRRRVRETAILLGLCRKQVDAWRQQDCPWLTDPMPVIQGWHPDDYRRSAAMADLVLEGEWPTMVGVGSVCRRDMGGEAGIVRIVEALDRELPAHVGLHLFGVKGEALGELATCARVVSADSMAWDLRARKQAKEDGATYDVAYRAAFMVRWYHRQIAAREDACKK